MKQLEVPFWAGTGQQQDLEVISGRLDQGPFHPIDIQPWPAFKSPAQARFALAHSGDALFIKFVVTEKDVRASYRQSNEPVYRDSCVEFFLAPGEGPTYYNLEFNCIGTCLMAYGTQDLGGRQFLSAAVIDKIRRRTWLHAGGSGAAAAITWELTAAIPLEVFCYHPLATLQGLQGSANFYKCGDELPEPHFLTWNEIRAAAPNFHLPEYFGQIVFQK
jgi:hypothetical protein